MASHRCSAHSLRPPRNSRKLSSFAPCLTRTSVKRPHPTPLRAHGGPAVAAARLPAPRQTVLGDWLPRMAIELGRRKHLPLATEIGCVVFHRHEPRNSVDDRIVGSRCCHERIANPTSDDRRYWARGATTDLRSRYSCHWLFARLERARPFSSFQFDEFNIIDPLAAASLIRRRLRDRGIVDVDLAA